MDKYKEMWLEKQVEELTAENLYQQETIETLKAQVDKLQQLYKEMSEMYFKVSTTLRIYQNSAKIKRIGRAYKCKI